MGRDLRKLQAEQESLEKLVRSWPEGQGFYTKSTMSGLFVQRSSILMIVAGEKKPLKPSLITSPYECDVIKELVGNFLFNFRSTTKEKDCKTAANLRPGTVRDGNEVVQQVSRESGVIP